MKTSQPGLQRAKRLRRPVQILWVLSVLAVFAAPPGFLTKFLYQLEDMALSLRFSTRGPIEKAADEPPIVLVGIDAQSLQADFPPTDLQEEPWLAKFEGGWPWPRSLHGELLRRLLEDGAETVAFDIEFPGEGIGDESFRKELNRAGDAVVLASKLDLHKADGIGVFYRESLPSESVLPADFPNSRLGFVNPFPDEDGVVRRMTLKTDIPHETKKFRTDPETLSRLEILSERTPDIPSFALAIAESVSESFQPPFEIETGASYLVNYSGRQGSFPILSAIDFFLPGQRERAAHQVDGAIVIIAPVAERFKDKYETSFEMLLGAEIHAHTLRNLLMGNFLRETGPGARALWLAALSLLAALATLVPRNVAAKSGLLVLSVVVWLVGCQLAFNLGEWVLPAGAGLLLLSITGIGLLVHEYLLEQMERRQVKQYLNRYVSSSVAKVLLEEGGGFERLRKGEVRAVSLLFSDIRGFTSASESRNPAELTAQLNEYFDAMVDPIFDSGGSLNKYIGDAIFAVWGDLYPRGEKTDATNALATAVQMRSALARLNRDWASQPDRVPFRIGIGLHQGDAFIGNVGHPSRLEVAVMGDAVNLAARIESANKFYGTDILISEKLVETAGNPAGLMEVDRVLLSGSSRPIDLFSPTNEYGGKKTENSAWVDRWNEAVSHYREKRFETALEIFESLEQAPASIRGIYLGRCRDFLHTSHTSDWSPVQKLEK